ncbi:MAG: hypothetical protein HOE94_10455 [Gemmatimonadales bacterium]|jgi:hypothetical protein|nr:hypothetical protein [Gemmatimonadales bacterium]MBT6887091.1 hypothetical protein [Gemmatimonadales bacterium]
MLREQGVPSAGGFNRSPGEEVELSHPEQAVVDRDTIHGCLVDLFLQTLRWEQFTIWAFSSSCVQDQSPVRHLF